MGIMVGVTMNEQTLKLLESLAAKFGTTTEYLWGVLIKQAHISATTDLVRVLITIIVASILTKKILSVDCDDPFYKWLGIGVIWVIIGGAFLGSIGGIVNGFVNPEYWALQQVIGARG
jgi:hypothetical protein